MTDTTTHTDTSAESDLAYLKRMAKAGRGSPAPFLLLMAVFGGAYGLFALVTGAFVLFETAGDQVLMPGSASQFVGKWGFVIANVAFLGAAVWTLWQTFGPRRIAVSRNASAIWSAAFIGLIAAIGAVTASVGSLHPMLRPEGLPSVLLVLWGSAWWATAIVSDRRRLLAIAIGSFVAAVVLPAVVPSLWGLPILATCLILLALLPAVLLMRERHA